MKPGHMEGFRAKLGPTMSVFQTVRHRRAAGIGLAACLVIVLAALTLPVPPPEPRNPGSRQDILSGAGARMPAPEELQNFLRSRRWGDESLQEVRRRAADEAPETKRRVRDKVGLVGLTLAKNQRASLMQLPDGILARFVTGDTLPDGRDVKSATDRTVTLEGDDTGQTEVLDLFPPIPQELQLAGPDAEPPGLPAGRNTVPAS